MDVVIITNGAPDVLVRLAAIVAGVPRGSVAIQIREKQLDGGPLLALSRSIVAIAKPAGAEVWINDRADIAILAGADGVHLPEAAMPIADVRALSSLRVGCSRHSAASARSCNADLVQLGPIFDTPGKQPIGLAPLAEARGAHVLVAVGGIDSEQRAATAVAAGADAVAVIRAAWSSSDPVAAIRALISGVGAGRSR